MAPQRVILMSCGSYNPPTNMHLRMFEIARDHLHRMGTHQVIGGVMSPVNDAYFKKELVHSSDRIAMLKLALQSNDWIKLSTWETRQNVWTRTLPSLTHHQNILNSVMLSNCNDTEVCIEEDDVDWIPDCVKQIDVPNSSIQIKLLCGADLLESFAVPNLWLDEDVDRIVSQHGLVIVTREGSDPNKFIYDSDILSKYMHNIFIVTEWIPNEISSTRIRRALKRGESVKYLLQDSVIDYIYKNGIYDARSPSKTKSDFLYSDTNNYLFKDFDTALTQSPSNVAITPIDPCDGDRVLEMNHHNSSRHIDNEQSSPAKNTRSSESSNQVPSDSSEKQKTNSAKPNRDAPLDEDNGSRGRLKTETASHADDEDSGPSEETAAEIDGKYLKSLVNLKKSPKRSRDEESRRSRRKEREPRKTYHSSSFRHRRYRDENSDDEASTIIRSSIAKKPLMRVPSMTYQSLNNATPSIFLQGSLDSINVDAPKGGVPGRLFEINSKKSKSYEYIKRSDPPRLSLVSQKPAEQSAAASQSDSTSKLITANDFDLPTEEFCSVCYLSNDPSSAEIFYTVPSNCSSPADDDSTKCDICSWNLQADAPDQSVPDDETCELCDVEEKPSLALSKLSLKLDEGDGVLEENPELENGLVDVEQARSPSPADPNLRNSIMFVPKDEVAMGKNAKRFSRKGSMVKKIRCQEKRRYASVDNLQYTRNSFKISGEKLSQSMDSKHMASADNIQSAKSFRSRSLRRSADNIGRYDSSGDNLDSLEENVDKDNGEEKEEAKVNSDTIQMILTQHGIKIISGKETVL